MSTDFASVTISNVPGSPGACELCGLDSSLLGASVNVAHTRGGAISLFACGGCVQAIRRLSAAAGSANVTFGLGVARGSATATGQSSSDQLAREAAAPPLPSTRPLPTGPGAVGNPEVVMEFTDHLIGAPNTRYVVQACGQSRTDGTWVGWLEFVSMGNRSKLRTGQETTQPDKGAVAYWATGLTPSYLEGAFRRAHPISTAA